MKNTTHRVVILKNVNSPVISQAILFLKDGNLAYDQSVMMEAERIVEKFMRDREIEKEERKKVFTVKKPVLFTILGGVGLLISALVFRFI